MKKITASRWSEIYLCALFALLPLLLHNGYFDITETKTAVFALLSGVYLALLLPAALAEREKNAVPSAIEAPHGKPGKTGAKSSDPCTDGSENAELGLPGTAGYGKSTLPAGTVCFLIFAGAELCSSLLFGGRAAFLAPHNRYQGIFIFLLYAGCASALSVWGRFTPRLRRFMQGAFVLVSMLAALNALGADPLGTLAPLRPADRSRYLSTVGNVNFLGAYTAMLLPLSAALFCTEEKKRCILPALGCILGMAALLTGSDCGLLGTGTAALLLPWLLRNRPTALRRMAFLPALLALSARLFAVCMKAWGGIGFSAAGRLLTRGEVTAAGCVLSLLLLLLFRRTDDGRLCRLAGDSAVFPAALLLGGSVFLLLANTVLRSSLPDWIERFARFDGDWGTDRGAIWAHCLRLFRAQGLPQKLIGGGAGCLARYDAAHRLFPDAIVDSAHNEYLHYLLTGGLVGLGGWLGALFCALRRAADGRAEDAALLAAVIGGAAQSAVNIAQCTTTPLLIVFLALLWGGDTAFRAEKS